MIVALANPIFAVVGVLAVIALLFGLFHKLMKLVIVGGIIAVTAWVVFFSG